MENDIAISTEDVITTDTCFGCFPCEAYVENTSIRELQACVTLCGTGKVELRHFDVSDDVLVTGKTVDSLEPLTVEIPVSLTKYKTGILYIRVTGESSVSDIRYEGTGKKREVRIAIIICTYRREKSVQKNLKLISDAINADPVLADSLDIICVDNGGTLASVPEHFRLIKNRNYGGSGGYARGMMETLERGAYTHFWMMDDDIEFEPEILLRAVSFMKYRNADDIRLAAGMFTFEEPAVQKEATALFNGYTFTSNAMLDLSDRKNLLKNRIVFKANEHPYAGWWSLITPAQDSLPMPFFIKMDDVEYGLRHAGKTVIMNGFGVWHEAFGKKGNAWTEYYTTRNTLIVQAMYPELPRDAVKMMGIRLLKALAYGEPKCMEASLQGVRDFAAGPEKFRDVDPEKRHGRIMDKYRAQLASDMTRKKMVKKAARNLLKVKNWRSVGMFAEAVKILKKCSFEGIGWQQMTTREFWKQYLR